MTETVTVVSSDGEETSPEVDPAAVLLAAGASTEVAKNAKDSADAATLEAEEAKRLADAALTSTAGMISEDRYREIAREELQRVAQEKERLEEEDRVREEEAVKVAAAIPVQALPPSVKKANNIGTPKRRTFGEWLSGQ